MEQSRPRKPRSSRSSRQTKTQSPTQQTSISAPLMTKAESQAALANPPQVPDRSTSRYAPVASSSSPSRDLDLAKPRVSQLREPSIATVMADAITRPTTAPPPQRNFSLMPHVPPVPSQAATYPRLRRKRSTIGRQIIPEPAQPATPLPPVLKPEDHRDSRSDDVIEAAPYPGRRSYTPSTEAPSIASNLPSPTQLHPAFRDSLRRDSYRSQTPLSYATSITPSTGYTASPAFSQVSSRTSASSYSPNMPSGVFGTLPPSKDSRRGPPLPSSPKAFKNLHSGGSRPSSQDVVSPPIIPPEFAHLNVDVNQSAPARSRPRRPSRDGAPDLGIPLQTQPVIQSELTSPTLSSPKPGSDQFRSPTSPMSPTSRRFFGFGSRSNSRESRHRKDSGISPASPAVAKSSTPVTGRITPGSEGMTSPSPAHNQPTRRGSSSRLGRLFSGEEEPGRKPNVLRKGPVAGTGHEGYGKFGFRGRNLSLTSLIRGRSRSRSADSNASDASARSYDSRDDDELDRQVSAASSTSSDVELGNSSTIRASPKSPAVDQGALVQAGLISNTSGGVTNDSTSEAPTGTYSSFSSTSYIGMSNDSVSKEPTSRTSSRHRSRKEGRKAAKPSNDECIERPKSSRKWNFFHRAQARSDSLDRAGTPRPGNELDEGKLGFYAISPEESSIGLDEIQNDVIGPQSRHSDQNRHDSGQTFVEPVKYDSRHESLMPPPPEPTAWLAKPRVQEARPEIFRLDSAESPEILHATLAKSARSSTVVDVPRSPSRSGSNRRPPSRNNAFAQSAPPAQAKPRQTEEPQRTPHPDEEDGGFVMFPTRQDSQVSYTSSSVATSFQSDTTLIDNAPPSTWLGDEDVWNEYNDFIDEVLPAKTGKLPKTPQSAGSSFGAPFQYDDGYRPSRPESKFLPQIHAMIEDLEAPPAHQDVPTSSSPDRFSQYLQPATTPSTPYSLSDIMAGYGDRTVSFASTKPRQSYAESRRSVESGYSSHYSRMSGGPSRPISKPDVETVSPVIEEQETPRQSRRTSMARKSRQSIDSDLRFGALMTSKWLSFGRVMFSPAHNEVKHGEDVRVLVVDGLGKDWSYYCALTYPKATFYNLEITTNEAKPSSRGQDLSNYKNVRHSSIGSPFPFPRGFFTAVILRFPTVATDKAYHSCIFECKRVLRPGGYLELATLDLDMMNMGSAARRTLRSLKMDMHARNPLVSLRNIGDTMLTLVGRRGFENMQRCIVGIPVAGRLPRSVDLGSDSSERSSLQSAVEAEGNTKDNGKGKGKGKGKADFAGILHSRQAESPTKARENDEGITKMIARVGRWWYSTCYGDIEGQERGMWEEHGLLRECERQGTAFRLLLCYARKPECVPRRTASV